MPVVTSADATGEQDAEAGVGQSSGGGQRGISAMGYGDSSAVYRRELSFRV
jgi:hypothetical protein